MLNIENFSAWYGQARALWNISLTVKPGEVVAMLGRNGAGKTTTLRSIAGLQKKTEGDIHFNSKLISGIPTHQIAREGITFLREGGRLPNSLNVLENLALGKRLAQQRGKPGRDLAEIWHWFPLLEPLQKRKAGLLSGGQRQALTLAVAFISEPSIILLDEPSTGLAPSIARDLFATIRQLAMTTVSILVVEQNPAWLIGVADRGYLLEIGSIVAEGSLEEITLIASKTAT